MSERFLRLDINRLGIFAAVVEPGSKDKTPREPCHVLFDESPDLEDRSARFKDALEKITATIDIRPCTTAVLFVSCEHVSFRIINPRFTSEKKIRQILPFEIETVLPYNNSEYINDFHRLASVDTGNFVLTASIPETEVEFYFSMLEPLGIRPVIISPKGYAAAAAFLESQKEPASFLFVYSGETETILVLIKDGIPSHVRKLAPVKPDSKTLCQRIKQAVIEFEQRTGTSVSCDLVVCDENDGKRAAAVYEQMEAMQVSPSGLNRPDADRPARTLSGKTSDPVVLSRIIPRKSVKYLFSFCKGQYQTNTFFETHSRSLITLGILVLTVFFLSIFNIRTDISALEKQAALIDSKAVAIYKAHFPGKTRITDPYLQMTAEVKAAFGKQNPLMAPGNGNRADRIPVLTLLDELSRQIPDSVETKINRMLYNNQQVTISGSAANFHDVDHIKNRIESSPMFKRVTISSAAADKKGDRVNYKFSIRM